MNNLRLRYGLHWRTDTPTHEIVQWLKDHWRMFLVLWIVATATVYALHLHYRNAQLADARFNAVALAESQYAVKMSGAPCTLASDYEDGKCVEVPDLKIHWR